MTSAQPRFRLEGEQIGDIDESMGPVFIHTLPVLTGDNGALHAVAEVIIGEEGSGRGRWKKSYIVPEGERGELSLDLRNRRMGWYYARLYDEDGKLLFSQNFRYLRGVTRVQERLPGPRDSTATLRFVHDSGVKITFLPSDR